MRMVGICCSVGRPSLRDLLAMWELQSLRLPLFVALDVPREWWLADGPVPLLAGLPQWVAQRAPEDLRHPVPFGALRAWSVERARDIFNLTQDDAFCVLDDDDYYSPDHAYATASGLQHCSWTGARRIGIEFHEGTQLPQLVNGGAKGPGPHATWGVRLSAYDSAGGYQADHEEDVALLSRWGWDKTRSHGWLTHVRRQYSSGSYSSEGLDREAVRPLSMGALVPHWTPRLSLLADWCACNGPSEPLT